MTARFDKPNINFIMADDMGYGDVSCYGSIKIQTPHRPCVPPDFIQGRSQAGPRGDMVALVDWMVGQIVERLTTILEDTITKGIGRY